MTQWRDRYFSFAILARPRKGSGIVEKGAIIVNQCDEIVRAIPEIKRHFYLVERKGWHGINGNETADVKLVDDLSTLEETKRRFPNSIALEFSNADFVDTDVFKPLGTPKIYDGIQIAAWKPFKRHDLFVKAAALLPERRFLKFGHFWDGGDKGERALRRETATLSKKLGARIKFPYSFLPTNRFLPRNPERINRIINSARMGILTSDREGVNRFKMECLSADIPFLVPKDAASPTKKHITKETGVLFLPTPRGLAEAIKHVEENYDSFSPRRYVLSRTGKENALRALKEALSSLADRDGYSRDFSEVRWDGRNQSLVWNKKKAENEVRRAIEEIRMCYNNKK